MLLNIDDFLENNPEMNVAHCPGFIKLSSIAYIDDIICHGLVPGVIYVYTAKGWDIKNEGREMYFVHDHGWYPSSLFTRINNVIPN